MLFQTLYSTFTLNDFLFVISALFFFVLHLRDLKLDFKIHLKLSIVLLRNSGCTNDLSSAGGFLREIGVKSGGDNSSKAPNSEQINQNTGAK